jgi:UDP-glucose 4-epimerase
MRENHQPETHLIPLAIDAALGVRPPLTIHGDDYDTDDGTCIRDYIHVLDLASAHLGALAELEAGRTVGPVNLGTGRGYSVRQVIEMTAQVIGRPVPHDVGPRRAGDPARLIADPRRAMAMLAWQPHRSELSMIVEDAARAPGAHRSRRARDTRDLPGRSPAGRGSPRTRVHRLSTRASMTACTAGSTSDRKSSPVSASI